MKTNSTLVYLQLLRVIASHAVVIGHAASYFGVLGFTQWPQSPYMQSVSVIVFFFVSGYTIAWLCDERGAGGYAFGRFVFDRACRILIPLIPILLIAAVAEHFIYSSGDHPYKESYSIATFFANVFMLHSAPLGFPPFGTNRPLWTIAPEWWLYVSYGFLALTLGGNRLFCRVSCWALFFVSLVFVAESMSAGSKGLGWIWLLGALTWYLVKGGHLKIIATSRLCVLIALTVFALCHQSSWPPDGSYSMHWNLLIAFLLLLTIVLASRWEWSLFRSGGIAKVVAYMGGYSYTLYLSHYPMMEFVYRKGAFERGSWVAFVLVVVCSLILAILLAHLFEFRYKAIRNKVWSLLTQRGGHFGAQAAV